MHEHFISVHLNVSPSAYLFFPLSLSLPVFLSPVTERKGHALSVIKECKLDEYDGLVIYIFFCFQNHCLVGIHQDFSIKKSRVRNYCKNNLQFKCSFVIIHP